MPWDLDTPASVVHLLNALEGSAGYLVDDIPADGDELVHRIIERCSNDRDSLTEEQLKPGRRPRGEPASMPEWYREFCS